MSVQQVLEDWRNARHCVVLLHTPDLSTPGVLLEAKLLTGGSFIDRCIWGVIQLACLVQLGPGQQQGTFELF